MAGHGCKVPPKNKSCGRRGICYIANSLQYKKEHFCQFSKSFVAILLMGLVLSMAALASSETLHKLIHHDADEAGHECAVTLFAHGQVDSPVVEVAAIIPVAPVEFLPLASVSVFNALVVTLPPGRGPPVSLLPS